MKTCSSLLLVAVLGLVACEAPAPRNSSSFYYPSTQHTPVPREVTSSRATATAANPVPRGGYAPGSGPTAMPQGDQFMYQENVSGPFGRRSSTGAIRSSGGVESYQTIGSTPVYPGMAVPGYMPGQSYYGPRTSQQPVFVPGVGGNPGYYMNPNTGARVNP